MPFPGVWKLLHLFFAFSFVGSLVVAEWNGRAARMSRDWSQRAVLFEIIRLSSRVAGFGALFLTGVFGNLVSVAAGYKMAVDRWLWCVNGLWIVAMLVMALVLLPSVARLSKISQAAARGGSSDGYESALARWRIGNVAQSVLYLGLLALMVFRWRS
jgi:hypothetical protein